MILQQKVARLSAGALTRFVARVRRVAGLRGAVNVMVTSNAEVRALNRRFRRQNKVTDVLSFPFTSASPASAGKGQGLAGDLAIAADIAVQNAARLGHSAAQEIKILILHGILHLAGFDHERDNGEMARKEAKLRRALGLPLALIGRTRTEGRRIEGRKIEARKIEREQPGKKLKRRSMAGARRTA